MTRCIKDGNSSNRLVHNSSQHRNVTLEIKTSVQVHEHRLKKAIRIQCGYWFFSGLSVGIFIDNINSLSFSLALSLFLSHSFSLIYHSLSIPPLSLSIYLSIYLSLYSCISLSYSLFLSVSLTLSFSLYLSLSLSSPPSPSR